MEKITNRELDVIKCLASGVTAVKDIAEEMIVSPTTVKSHLNNLYSKTYVTDKVQLLLFALKNNLVSI